jgi:hypothetical protein
LESERSTICSRLGGAARGVFGLEGLGTHRGAQALAVEAGQGLVGGTGQTGPGRLRRGRPSPAHGMINTNPADQITVKITYTTSRDATAPGVQGRKTGVPDGGTVRQCPDGQGDRTSVTGPSRMACDGSPAGK